MLLATKSNTASCSDDAKSLLESKECIGRSQCSLETLLTPGSVTNLSLSTAELKMVRFIRFYNTHHYSLLTNLCSLSWKELGS